MTSNSEPSFNVAEYVTLEGTWHGKAIMPAAKCQDSERNTLMCCPPGNVNVNVSLRFWQDKTNEQRYKLDYTYTSIVSIPMPGAFIYQPTFSFTLEILTLKDLTQAIKVESAAAINQVYCLFLHKSDSDINSLKVSLRTRSNVFADTWTQEYWCEDEVVPVAVDGCAPGTLWPPRDQNDTSVFRSGWHTSMLELVRANPIENNGVEQVDGGSAGTSGSGINTGVLVGGLTAGILLVIAIAIAMLRRFRGSKAASEEEEGKAEIEEGGDVVRTLPDLEQSYLDKTDMSTSMDETSATWGLVNCVAKGVAEHWLLPLESVVENDYVIGAGGFGEVRRGMLYGSTPVAIKTCKGTGDAEAASNIDAAMINEIRILRRLRHPNIVLFFGLLPKMQPVKLGIILEWVEGMDLGRYIQMLTDNSQMPADEVSTSFGDDGLVSAAPRMDQVVRSAHIPRLLMDSLCGLHFLHAQSPSVMHRDLKPSNILVETIAVPPRAKLTDFGLSRIMTSAAMVGGAGTRKYVAPEVLLNKPFTVSADIYSFGRTCCAAILGGNILKTEAQEFVRKIKSGFAERMIDLQVQQVIVMSVNDDPELRPTATDFLQAFQTWTTAATSTAKSGAPSVTTSTSRGVSL
eukprot:TRINITY_DN18567_c0_g1_i1.p1 TRINITY_DN18567_c0_g1~~TRINITY_DN18567_c0_g1_i1.p1  ORF type:complete len:628 (+),score=102.68 TRINITY_DN18567_c0_g1_i1:94-1977(+)